MMDSPSRNSRIRLPKYGVWISAPPCSISPALPTMAALPKASTASTPPSAAIEPVGEQPGQHRRDARRVVGQVVRRTRAHPGVAHHGGDAGLPRRTDGSCAGLGHHHLAVDDQLTDADVGSRTALLHATEQ